MAAVLLFVSLLCSCSKTLSIKFPEQFESNFDGSIGNLQVSGFIKKETYGICSISLNFPETLNGLEIRRVGETVTLCFNDNIISEQLTSFPANSIMRSVCDALDSFVNTSLYTVTETTESIKYSSNESELYALLNKSDGTLKSINIGNDIILEFNNFVFIQ